MKASVQIAGSAGSPLLAIPKAARKLGPFQALIGVTNGPSSHVMVTLNSLSARSTVQYCGDGMLAIGAIAAGWSNTQTTPPSTGGWGGRPGIPKKVVFDLSSKSVKKSIQESEQMVKIVVDDDW